jgi:hypothetical protein
MRSSFPHPLVPCLALVCPLSCLLGCTAVSGGNLPSSQAPSQPSIIIMPATAQIRAGDTQPFVVRGSVPPVSPGKSRGPQPHAVAVVVRPTNRTVIWSVNGIRGGNATVGTIESRGLYTAPATLPNPNFVTVTATSVGDLSLSAAAPVTLQNPIPIVTSVTPTTISVGSFTLTVKGRGLVPGAQVLLAGVPLQTTFISATQLTATGIANEAELGGMQVSVQNPDPGSATSTTSFNVQVNKPVIQASVSPSNTILRAMDTQHFTATIQGTSNSAANWSVNGIPGGNATLGTISPTGLYVAPVTLPNPNVVKVAATSAADPSVSATVSVTLNNPIPVVTSISPNTVSVGSFTLTINGRKFVKGARVIFAGRALQTTFNSPSRLTAVGTATQAQVGNAQILLTNPAPGSANSSAPVTVQVTAPEKTTPPDLSQADIVVDGSVSVSETGTDDLAAAKNIYSSASAPESDGGLSTDWSLISSQFSMKRMRNINGLGDCGLDTSGKLTGCSRLNNDLSSMKSKGLTPHVIVGQWAPSSIGRHPLQWGANEWRQYDALCYAIVDHVVNRYGGTGFNEVLFEVENEIDITTSPDDLWLTPTSTVPQGDPSRFAQYDTVYRHWAKAVTEVAQQSAGKHVRIAAQAEGFERVSYRELWHNRGIQTFAAQGVKLDVISLHIYGGDSGDWVKYAQSIRSTLVASGLSHVEIWVTEWGASSSGDSYFGAINGSHQGAAWGIHFLLQALKGTVTGGSFLEVRDNHGHDMAGVSANLYNASWNHVENSVEYPKAIANAFSMVDHMKGTRKSALVSSGKPTLYALASADAGSASLVVANYNYLFDWTNKHYSDLTTEETVTVGCKNLPFSGPVMIDRYLVDANTSNLDHWSAAGGVPPSVQAAQLQKVESFSAVSVEGTVALPAQSLGQSAVSLWIVHQ